MENNNDIKNNEDKKLEARRRAARAFHARNKNNEEYKMKQRANSKRVYENDKERIIARVKANQRRNQETGLPRRAKWHPGPNRSSLSSHRDWFPGSDHPNRTHPGSGLRLHATRAGTLHTPVPRAGRCPYTFSVSP